MSASASRLTWGGANTGSVFGKLNALLSAGGGVVKSVQSGMVQSDEYTGNEGGIRDYITRYKDYTISEVNMQKALLIVYGGYGYASGNDVSSKYDTYNARGRIVANNKIRLYVTEEGDDSLYVSNVFWQVIEFY